MSACVKFAFLSSWPDIQVYCALVCKRVISCVHKADDEQQFGDAVQSKTSGQVMVFWTLVSGLCGSSHLFDPLNDFLICWRGNGAEGLVQMLAAHVRERPLLPPHRGVLHHLRLGRQPVGLDQYLLQLG